jgi:hypothetical protein
MTLTSKQAQALRLTLLTDLERGETNLEFDQRFIKPIFGGMQELLQWCKSWNIECESYTRRGMNDSAGVPITWIGFKKPTDEQKAIFIIEDKNL